MTVRFFHHNHILYKPLLCLLLVMCARITGADADDCDLQFTPRGGSVITIPACTLSVEGCDRIKSVRFQSKYFDTDGKTIRLISVGVVTRPPYKLVWNTSDVTNQVFAGATLYADVAFRDNSVTSLQQEGIFLLHNAFKIPRAVIPYATSITEHRKFAKIELPNEDDPKRSVQIKLSWNKKNIIAILRTKDPLFYDDISKQDLSNLGCEFLFSQDSPALPYPSLKSFALEIPLHGEAKLRYFKPVFSENGTYQIETQTKDYPYDVNIKKSVSRGWQIVCVIPMELFGKKTPATVRCNVVANTAFSDKNIIHQGWNGSNFNEYHSPLHFGVLELTPRPWIKNPFIIWLLSFVGGLILYLSIFSMFHKSQKRQSHVERFEMSEEEKRVYDAIKNIIEEKLTQPSLNVTDISKATAVPEARVNKILKKFTGCNFQKYVIRSRIEIVKERLRSSNASEASISKTCGFSNVNEMERHFKQAFGVTPYTYRAKQQVT